MKKPSFDLSDLGAATSLAKCRDFLPLLQQSNAKLTAENTTRNVNTLIDADMELYHGEPLSDVHSPEGKEGEIFLDVGVGVFDVGESEVDEDLIRQHQITTVTLDRNSQIFTSNEPLVTEIEPTTKK